MRSPIINGPRRNYNHEINLTTIEPMGQHEQIDLRNSQTNYSKFS